MDKYIYKTIWENPRKKKNYLEFKVNFETGHYHGTFKVWEEPEVKVEEQKFTVEYFEKFMEAYSIKRDKILDEKLDERDKILDEKLDERDKKLKEELYKKLDEKLDEKLKPIIEDLEYLKSLHPPKPTENDKDSDEGKSPNKETKDEKPNTKNDIVNKKQK